MYMSLFYETRIRPIVLSRWAKDKLVYPGTTAIPDLPEDESLAEDEDSYIFRDMKIPISYKNSIARELWEAEDEGTKKRVRSRRDTGEPPFRTAYNTEGKERVELVQGYAK